MRTLTWQEIKKIHSILLEGSEEPKGIRFAPVKSTWKDNFDLAKDIIKNHYFWECNKRTAMMIIWLDEITKGSLSNTALEQRVIELKKTFGKELELLREV